MGGGRLAQAGGHPGGCGRAAARKGHRVHRGTGRSGAGRRKPGAPDGRPRAGLRLPGDHHRAATGLRRSAGPGPGGGFTQSICTDAARAAGLASLPEIPRAPGPDRDRRGAGRELLRPRLRVRDDRRCRPAQAQAARPGADDLRHQRAVHRPHGPGRRRRFQGADGIGAAPAPHQVDHQRQDQRVEPGRIKVD